MPEEVLLDEELQNPELEYPTEEELFANINEEEEPTELALATKGQFTVRTSKPSKDEKYAKCYIVTESGGWCWAIKGYPRDPELDALANCVGWCQGRFCEVYNEITGYTGINKYQYLSCDAKNFITRVKQRYPELEIGDEPKPGSILVMGHKTKAGHVIFVERVNADKSIFTSESAYGGRAFYNATRHYSNGTWGMASGYYQIGFIYNPVVEDTPIITPSVARNENVDQIQVTINNLRCRTAPSLDATILGFLQKDGYYNISEAILADGYTWFKIADDQWCAQDDSLIILPKVEALKIGDHVLLNGPLYASSRATKQSGTAKNKDTHITRYVEGTLHPYNTTGDLGWCDASSMTKLDLTATAHSISVETDNTVTVEADKDHAVPFEVVHINVTVATGYKIKSMTANGVIIKDNMFIMPSVDVIIKIVTEPIKYKIVIAGSKFGTISTDKTSAIVGELVQVTCNPIANYKVSTISVTGSNPFYNDEGKICFTMPANDVVVGAEFEKIVQPIFKVGDKVTILKAGNSEANGTGFTTFNINEQGMISKIVWQDSFTLEPFCYLVQTWDGTIFGYYKEEDLELFVPIVNKEYAVGDTVKIVGKGNSRADGTGYTTYGLGWKETVMGYTQGEEYPYKVGKNNAVQGYYKETDLIAVEEKAKISLFSLFKR